MVNNAYSIENDVKSFTENSFNDQVSKRQYRPNFTFCSSRIFCYYRNDQLFASIEQMEKNLLEIPWKR